MTEKENLKTSSHKSLFISVQKITGHVILVDIMKLPPCFVLANEVFAAKHVTIYILLDRLAALRQSSVVES